MGSSAKREFKQAIYLKPEEGGGGGGVLPNDRLMGLCHWMVSHCHGWIGSDGVAFFMNLLE